MGDVGCLRVEVFLANHFLQFREPLGLVLFAKTVLSVGLQVQEVRADRPVTILKARENNPVLHLRHLRTGVDQEAVSRSRRPRCIPRPTRSFTDRARFKDVRRATCGTHNRLRFEDVIVAGADVKANSASDAVLFFLVHEQVRNADTVEDLIRRLFRSLCHDWLVGLAVDHDLPAAFAKVLSRVRVFHDRQTPVFKLVNRAVDVAGHIEQQILADHAHQIDPCITDVIFGVILAPARTHVTVDRVEALSNRTRAVDIGFLGDDDLFVLAPIASLESGARAAQTCTDDQYVDTVFDYRFMSHQ